RESDMARRYQDTADLSAVLSIQQETALHALMSGATQAEAAERAGVARETVCRWLQDDADFVAALNRARKEIRDASIDRLQLLALKSSEVLAKLLEHDDPRIRLVAAQTALKAAGLEGSIAPIGPTDAADIERSKRKAAEQQSLDDLISQMSDLS